MLNNSLLEDAKGAGVPAWLEMVVALLPAVEAFSARLFAGPWAALAILSDLPAELALRLRGLQQGLWQA